jgi:hypothetical protein
MTHKVESPAQTTPLAAARPAGGISPAQLGALQKSINTQLENNDTGIDQSGVAASDWNTTKAPAGCPPNVAALFDKWSAGTAPGNAATLYKFAEGGHTVWGVRQSNSTGLDNLVLFAGAKEVGSGKINGSGTYDWSAK